MIIYMFSVSDGIHGREWSNRVLMVNQFTLRLALERQMCFLKESALSGWIKQKLFVIYITLEKIV